MFDDCASHWSLTPIHPNQSVTNLWDCKPMSHTNDNILDSKMFTYLAVFSVLSTVFIWPTPLAEIQEHNITPNWILYFWLLTACLQSNNIHKYSPIVNRNSCFITKTYIFPFVNSLVHVCLCPNKSSMAFLFIQVGFCMGHLSMLWTHSPIAWAIFSDSSFILTFVSCLQSLLIMSRGNFT